MSMAEPLASQPAAHGWPAAILFDLDGTLIDSVPDITLAVNELMALDGLAAFSEPDVRAMVGHGLGKLMERAYLARAFGLTEALWAERRAAMIGIYSRNLTGGTTLMPGAREFIAAVAGEVPRLGLVTNKLQSATEEIVDHFGLRDAFTVIVGDGRPGLKLKPAPDMLLFAAEALGQQPQDVVMVGDSAADIQSARAAGIASILVRGGYLADSPETLGADLVIDDLWSLGDGLRRLSALRAGR